MNINSKRNISRRTFFKLSLGGVGCCLLSSVSGAISPAAENESAPADNYYLLNRDQIIKAFRDTNEGARQWLASKYGEEIAIAVTREAEKEFEALLPLLPDVGGKKNIMIVEIPIIAWYAAFYRPLKQRDIPANVLGKMIYDLNDIELGQIPEAAARAEGAKKFTPGYIDKLQKWAFWTEKKEYPANWVASFVPGNGKDFDYGYDYSECALVKYLKACGAGEVAPFVCLNDFIRSRTYGTGLHRTKTLAQGDNVCNFRYKKGCPVTQDWSTEIGLIRARIKEGRI
ncbi:MAG: L-2-amino-thiazoline-4-carboxylic acid hydrolase [PVC group bacterium]